MRLKLLTRARRGVRRLTSLIALSAVLAVLAPVAHAASDLVERARAGAFSAEGLYDPLVVRHDNGLTLVAKSRPGIRTVSVRVSVGVGMAHYACGQQHVPHFLEHMLFGAIPGLSEAELERRFFELGAASNARTQGLQTVYELDVFSGTAFEAMDLVADMLTRAKLDQGGFESTKRIIWREMGGEPGPVELQSLPGGPLASGFTEAAADLSPQLMQGCAQWDAGQEVEFRSVERAYSDHYAPSNMTWVIVGDIDLDRLTDWFENRLGRLPGGEDAGLDDPEVGEFEKSTYTGLAGEPGIAVMTRTSGFGGSDYYARRFISHLLDETLYRRLRLDRALTYTPYSLDWSWPDWGLFGISAEAAEDDHEEALEIIHEIMEELRSAPLEPEEFRAVQLSLLREWAQGVETNADYAEHYVSSLFELRRNGRFTHDEIELARLTPERVHEVAARLFRANELVTIRNGDRMARIDVREDEEP